MIGKTISRYRILEQVGAGGMGVVYRAHDEQLERDVAIKVLPPGMLADAAARRRFRKEALSLARVNFPSIATIHEFGSEDDVDFLVTEYIPGATLDTKLHGGGLPQQEVVQLGIQLAQGLAAAHQHGIVHRDLKPGNLRITPDGRLKILDFGLAQFAPQVSELAQTVTLTKSAELTGTLPYMAPEQLKGEPADPRSDLWAAGAVLYEMTTGKRPFPQNNSALLINSILNEQPAAPRAQAPGIAANLENVILKALEKDPARRYQSAVEMCVDLERILHPSTHGTGAMPYPPRRSRPKQQLCRPRCGSLPWWHWCCLVCWLAHISCVWEHRAGGHADHERGGPGTQVGRSLGLQESLGKARAKLALGCTFGDAYGGTLRGRQAENDCG